MSPQKTKRPGLAGTGSENIRSKQTRKIIAFPAANATCRGCGIQFIRAQIHHRLCSTCYSWNKALHGIEAARDALKAVSS